MWYHCMCNQEDTVNTVEVFVSTNSLIINESQTQMWWRLVV